jgi:hypothetical protein
MQSREGPEIILCSILPLHCHAHAHAHKSTQAPQVCQLQRLFFKHWPELRELALMNCGAVEQRAGLKRALAALPPDRLRVLVVDQLRLVAPEDSWADDNTFLMEVRGRHVWRC